MYEFSTSHTLLVLNKCGMGSRRRSVEPPAWLKGVKSRYKPSRLGRGEGEGRVHRPRRREDRARGHYLHC